VVLRPGDPGGKPAWTLPTLRVVALGWRTMQQPGEFDARCSCGSGPIFVLVFFSLSDSKLIPTFCRRCRRSRC